MNKCDLIIANMTSFRGPSMDVGTAFEIGYMTAQGKPVWGYSLDGRLYCDRIEHRNCIDTKGMSVEAFDMADNLMMVGASESILTESQPDILENHLLLLRKVLEQIKHRAQI